MNSELKDRIIPLGISSGVLTFLLADCLGQRIVLAPCFFAFANRAEDRFIVYAATDDKQITLDNFYRNFIKNTRHHESRIV